MGFGVPQFRQQPVKLRASRADQGLVAEDFEIRRVVLGGGADVSFLSEEKDLNVAELLFQVVAVFLCLRLVRAVNRLGRTLELDEEKATAKVLREEQVGTLGCALPVNFTAVYSSMVRARVLFEEMREWS